VCVVWNAYRKCRILLLNFISICTDRLGDHDESPEASNWYSDRNLNKEVRELSVAVTASIPFLIYQNPSSLLVQSSQHDSFTSERETLRPGHAYGGLLLMHVLYVVSRLPIVSEPHKNACRAALIEIGDLMGIGQAKLLANVRLSKFSFLPVCLQNPHLFAAISFAFENIARISFADEIHD